MKHTFLTALAVSTTMYAAAFILSCSPQNDGTEPFLDILTTSIETGAQGGELHISYTLGNVPEDARPEVSVPGAEEWITDFDLSENGTVSFNVQPNTTVSARQATVRISYNDLSGKCIVSQSGNSSGNQGGEEYDVDFTATVLCRGIYYGDAYSSSAGNYFVTFGDTETEGNYGDYVQPDGTYYTLDIYADMWDGDMDAIGIPEGTYELDRFSTGEKGTFSKAYGQYAQTDSDGNIVVSMQYIDGTCNITKDGDNYNVDIVLTLEDSAVHHVKYYGPIICQEYREGSNYEYIEEDIDFNMYIAQAVYNEANQSVLLQFTDMMADDNGQVAPPGILLNVTAYMEITEEGQLAGATLVPGTDKQTGTFIPGEMVDYGGVFLPEGSYAEQYFSATHLAYGFITGGSIVMKGDNGIYDISIDLTTSEGFHITSYSASKEIPLYGYRSEDTPMSSLTEDKELDLEGVTARANYFGDYYKTGGDNWMIALTPSSGNDGFQIDYVGTGLSGFSNGLPTGTFSVSNTGEQGTFVAGYQVGSDMYSTWYLGDFDNSGRVSEFAPAVDGTITVTQNSNGTYTITFDVYDDAGQPNRIYGSWTGDVSMSDVTTAQAGVQSSRSATAALNAAEKRSLR